MLKLNTQILFRFLTKALSPDGILDIGSMDGTDALSLMKLSKKSKCFAFEANPYNFSVMSMNQTLGNAGIAIINQAVSSSDGQIKFYVAQPAGSDEGWVKGTSSMLKRMNLQPSVEEVEIVVKSVKLNTFLGDLDLWRCALWIDVEGAAYQVLTGANLVAERIAIGHVEVEDTSVWGERKNAVSVQILLENMGFKIIARGRGENQHDIVFVSKEIAEKPVLKILVNLAFLLTLIRKYLGKIIAKPIYNFIIFMIPPGCINPSVGDK